MGAAAIPAALVAGGSVMSAVGQGESAKATAGYYGYLGSQANANANLAQARAKADTKNISMEAGQQEYGLTRRVNQAVGTQKASLVSGAGASSRTAQDIIKDTLETGNRDEMALRWNADQRSRMTQIGADTQAMNYRGQAAGYGMAGRNTMIASRFGQASTLLGGAGSVASIWYRNQYTG